MRKSFLWVIVKNKTLKLLLNSIFSNYKIVNENNPQSITQKRFEEHSDFR